MLSSSVPTKFQLPWGADAGAPYINSIPVQSQIGTQNGRASLTDGFPPLTFVPSTAGGMPPFGGDFNGIFKWVTQVQQWQQAGGLWTYDSDFSTSIGGYPNGAILESAIVPGRLWLNTTDNNTQDPDEYPFTGWTTLPGMNAPGTPIPSFQATVLSGCVIANGRTIGNTGSGGSSAPAALASPTAFFLFCAIWAQFSQSLCPVMFNGVPVTRGANPLADWNAGRVIALPAMNGAGVIGQDNMGGATSTLLNGVPVSAGSTITPGSIVGENFHTLTAGEIPNLHATGTNLIEVSGTTGTNAGLQAALGSSQVSTGGGTFSFNEVVSTGNLPVISSGNNVIGTITDTTGGQSDNTVQRSFTVAWNLAL